MVMNVCNLVSKQVIYVTWARTASERFLGNKLFSLETIALCLQDPVGVYLVGGGTLSLPLEQSQPRRILARTARNSCPAQEERRPPRGSGTLFVFLAERTKHER